MNQDPETTNARDPDGESPKYWAFISYSHRDAKWADWLHRALETYRVPRRLVGHHSRDGTIPRRLYPVFRDREELPTASSLDQSIEQSLHQARYLIVICSPHAAASRWVNEEVRLFKAMGREGRICCLIVDGEPNATDNLDGGLPECFPPALRHRVTSSGELSQERTEPIAADSRPGGDGKQTAKLRLLAGLLGVSFDELKRRERQRVIRRRIQWTCLATAILISLFGVWKWQEQRRWEQVRQEQIRDLTEAGRQELVAGKTLRAAVYLSEAYRQGANDAATRLMLAWVMRPLDTNVATLRGHTKPVNLATYSSNGGRILTASDDGLAKVWDAKTYQPIATLEGHKWFVRLGAFLSDSRLFTVGTEGVVRLWQADSGKLLGTIDGEYAVASRSGEFLVVTNNGQATVWNAETVTRIATLEEETLHLADVEFSPDGSRVVGGGGLDVNPPQNALPRGRIWATGTGKVLAYLDGHSGAINSVAFAPDGNRVATTSLDRTAKVWAADSGELLASFDGHPGSVPCAAFSPDGTRLLTFSENVAAIWNLSKDQEPVLLLHQAWINTASFSPDGKRVVTAANDDSAQVWDTESGQRLLSLRGHTGRVHTAEFGPDGHSIVTSSWDTLAKVWDAGQLAVHVMPPKRRASSATFSPDGARLAVGGQRAEIWEAKTGKVIRSIDAHPEWGVRSVAFSPDGKRLVTASEDRTCKVLDVATGAELTTFRGHDARVMSASFSHDGRRVVSAALDHTAQVWDAATGAMAITLKSPNGQVSFASFSPDGKQIVVAAGLSVGIWDVATGELQVQMPDQLTGPGHVVFHPDGQRVASTNGNAVNLWEISSQKLITSFVGHQAQVNRVALNSDGTLLVTSSNDGTVRLWGADSGKTLLVLQCPSSQVDTAEFGPHGRFVVSSSFGGTVRIWDVPSESREPQVVADLVQDRVSLRIVEGRLVPK
ncbi:MAG: TIR domain-containing protein [Phycisphaeraceae bacterium]|nr:TIR domain-containing protein [Phycisphaeraceae bacterium]